MSTVSNDRSIDFDYDFGQLCFLPGMTMEGLVNEEMFSDDFMNIDLDN